MRNTFAFLLASFALAGPLLAQEFVDIALRDLARQHFIDHFQTTEPAIGWTGDSTTGGW